MLHLPCLLVITLVILGVADGLIHPLSRSRFSFANNNNNKRPTTDHHHHPGTANCTEYYFTQPFDHFRYSAEAVQTFQQRYYLCKPEWWHNNSNNINNNNNTPVGPIFFYTGNEANVELYVNQSGLMWEHAEALGAMMVFAEHRYFGKSLLFPEEGPMPAPERLVYLTTSQALADYASLIYHIRRKYKSAGAERSAVVGFGGSYGGMLCAWLRAKYPTALDGCISGSAPVWAFLGINPTVVTGQFNSIVTYDASAAGGAGRTDNCKININKVFRFFYYNASKGNKALLKQIAAHTNLCHVPEDNTPLLNEFQNAIGMMAMGSYPYPSAYMLLGGKGVLPPYPLRAACSHLQGEYDTDRSPSLMWRLLERFAAAMHVFYDADGKVACLDINAPPSRESQITNYLWNYLWCTELLMPQSSSGVLNTTNTHYNNSLYEGDMFFPAPWNLTQAIHSCQQQYKVTPNPLWVGQMIGGQNMAATASNIFFINGELDPWRYAGIVPDDNNNNINKNKNSNFYRHYGRNIEAAVVRGAGHHMDLMFSEEQDKLTNVREVRQWELEAIHRYIEEKRRGSS